jgi:uncharacterized protein YbjT (DUF2867 family)
VELEQMNNRGSLVVDRLLQRGDRPRVFVRNAIKAGARYGDRVDIVTGDLGDAASLSAAMHGIDALLLINSGKDLATRDEMAANLARAAGVKRLVKLSTMDVNQGVGTGVWHAKGEAAIRASGVVFTFVEPSGFMTNALAWAEAMARNGVVRAATGNGKIGFIHPQDIADVATAALTSAEYENQSLPISGPNALSYAEMVAKIGEVTGKRLKFELLSDEDAAQELVDSGEPPESVVYHLSIFRAIREGRMAIVTDTVQRVLGRPALTFDQWARENADSFC